MVKKFYDTGPRTVVITGQAKGSAPQNVSLVFIDDSKSVDNLNITLSSKVRGDKERERKGKKVKEREIRRKKV